MKCGKTRPLVGNAWGRGGAQETPVDFDHGRIRQGSPDSGSTEGRSENFEHSETLGPMRGPCGAPARVVLTLAHFFSPKITTTGVHMVAPSHGAGP